MVSFAHLDVCGFLVSLRIENCCVMLWYKRFRQFAVFVKKWEKKKRGVLATLWAVVWNFFADCMHALRKLIRNRHARFNALDKLHRGSYHTQV